MPAVRERAAREAHAVPEPALVRGLRRRRGLALPGAPRDPLVLVPDLARAGGRAGPGQRADRRAARGPHAATTSSRAPASSSSSSSTPRRRRSRPDAKTAAALKAREPARRRSASSARTRWCCPTETLAARARGRLRHDRRVRRGGRGARAGPRARGRRRHRLPRARTARPSARAPRAPDHRPRPLPVRHRRLRAAPRRRALRHRLPPAPLRVALHRPRLPEPLHVLPLAADDRRPRLPHAQRRERARRDGAREARSSRRCASSSSTTTPSPTTGRAPRRSRAASASSASPGRATPRRTCPSRRSKALRDNGLRLLLVGFESGEPGDPEQHPEGHAHRPRAAFAADCRKLGILLHGTFILGLPGETRETIERTIAFAKEVDPYSLQVSLAAPYPGHRALSRRRSRRGWLPRPESVARRGCVDANGFQEAVLVFADLPPPEMHAALERFYREFYFRPRPILRIVRDMLRDREVMRRRLREGREFLSFMVQRRESRGRRAACRVSSSSRATTSAPAARSTRRSRPRTGTAS